MNNHSNRIAANGFLLVEVACSKHPIITNKSPINPIKPRLCKRAQSSHFY